MNLEYALGCKKQQDKLTEDIIKDNQSPIPVVTLDNPQACQKYFRIIDYWNDQINKGMGWTHESNPTD